jgi:hypothetical protein
MNYVDEPAKLCKRCGIITGRHRADDESAGGAGPDRRCGDARDVNVYAAHTRDALLVAMVNKSDDPVQAKLHGGMTRAPECWKLTAPSLDAKDGVEFARANMDERLIPAYAAVAWRFLAAMSCIWSV